VRQVPGPFRNRGRLGIPFLDNGKRVRQNCWFSRSGYCFRKLNALLQTSLRVNDPQGAGVRKVGAALLVVCVALAWLQAAAANEEPGDFERRKSELEVQKLQLEVSKLKREQGQPWWLPSLFGLVTGVATGVIAGVASGVITFRAAHWARLAELDRAVHEKRLELYPILVKATSRLAIYFPEDGLSGRASVQPDGREAMGRAMSQWYFDHGGLLLSRPARKAYFRLARGLTLAARAETLKVPTFPHDSKHISMESVSTYEREIREMKQESLNLDDVENWEFGGPASEQEPNHLKFKDYVFLRNLTSELRTTLTEDLRGRLRPA
jgi:hypothetical protein